MTSAFREVLHTKILINVFRNLELGIQGGSEVIEYPFYTCHAEQSGDIYLGRESSELLFKHLYCQISAIC